jgi:hypothetical protein
LASVSVLDKGFGAAMTGTMTARISSILLSEDIVQLAEAERTPCSAIRRNSVEAV